jgi:glutathione S-transferase
VITLWQYRPALGLPNASPFCMKVETWLRMSGLEYTTRNAFAPNKAPLGKLPYADFDGRRVPDSSSIIAELSQVYGVDLDSALDARQRAVAQAFARMVEEHLYWALVYSRWIDPAHWPVFRGAFFRLLPPPARNLVARLAQRKVVRDAHGHGLGRHPPQEIYRRAGQDIGALAGLLGDNTYMMGEAPCSLDATAYAFLANCWDVPLDTPLQAAVGRHANLISYCARMKKKFY